MLFLSGQALAIAEQLEEEQKSQQRYSILKARLQSIFDTAADREIKQTLFENRTRRLNESEDEFMLTLTKLHRSANPTASTEDLNRNVKRKFLNGISPELRRNIFIFCNDPYKTDITTEKLLEATRKAKLHLMGTNEHEVEVNNITQQESSTSNSTSAHVSPSLEESINNLTTLLSQHIETTESKFKNHDAQINAINFNTAYPSRENDRSSYFNPNNRYAPNNRGHYNRNNYTSNRTSNLNMAATRSVNEVICFACGGKNHFARNCTASVAPLNSQQRL